jgi:pantoate--beta-alanine ligase
VKVIATVAEMAKLSREVKRPLGLVPTMGYLHQGHLSLVERAREENQTLVVSVFVNPAQFGPQEDLAAYPRDMERDMALLKGRGTDIVFAPPVEEMYPPGYDYDTWVVVDRLARRLEGEARPGHFRGVATVVAKLFNIVRPDRAYFGQKDGQQAAVIKRMASDLNMGVQVAVLPTVREPDGLAMSSRNIYLTPEQRKAAPALYRALSRVRELWQGGERDAERLRREARAALEAEPLVEAIDYVSVADAETLEELDTVDRPAMVSLAARMGRARLIDNVVLR